MLKTLRKIFITLFLLASLAGALIGYRVYKITQYKNPESVTIKFKKGSSVKKIAKVLENNQVIENKWVFEYYLRFTNKERLLKAGEYDFDKGLGFTDVIDQMIEGRVKLYKFTLPEGYNLRDFCQLMIEKKLMTSDQCEKQIQRVSLLNDNQEAKNLEGYLFPETYLYDSDFTPSSLTERMVKMFYQQVEEDLIQKAKKMGYTLHQLVTFASLIEKETGVESERPMIASVFHNRLKLGMLLQTDPTVIYGIKDFDGNLRRKHLEEDHPYNTYTRAGLPPGPICSPGLASIEAVLSPAQSENLYFVAKGDGSHYFSKTLAEHNKAVRYYQLKQGSKPE